jgi:hypothetical protein
MSFAVLALIACAIVVLIVSVVIGALVLLKTGVLVRHAVKPNHLEPGDYRLSQGREVRPEEQPELPERR